MNYYYNPPKNSKIAKDLNGGSLLGVAGKLYGQLVKNWGLNGIKGLKAQKEEIKALEEAIKKKKKGGSNIGKLLEKLHLKKPPKRTSAHVKGKAVGGCAACKRYFEQKNQVKGGKVTGRDVLDFFAGPIGWAFMGVRKKREKQIDKLKKELNSLEGNGKSDDYILFSPESYITPQIRHMMALNEFK